METTMSHFGNWAGVILWIVLYGVFILFLPFYKKSQRKSSSAYIAFVIAYALEMFGVPMSMYIIAWAFGQTLPEGFLWGHTLVNQIGLGGMYVGFVISLIGVLLVILGWREIHQHYWSKEEGQGQLVTHGIYAYIRHPQYTGFLLITLGMMFEWTTLPLLIMWPILAVLYYRLAKKEEADMEEEFGKAYIEYKQRTSMFLPSLSKLRTVRATSGSQVG
ncbi:MAG: isoprenylcysteine carboxylmethyltransferase family protein [Chloroflexi bacterium]|nr:isoprenylcysteine carboxylmethyltransferase family protein [Chloroflexota bacterium]MBM4428923.1 isoprenylcysteine carboxylmethyltransferase family protein [Chloroflexota bacterium]